MGGDNTGSGALLGLPALPYCEGGALAFAQPAATARCGNRQLEVVFITFAEKQPHADEEEPVSGYDYAGIHVKFHPLNPSVLLFL